MPTAWSTAMLAWGLQDFPAGYNSSGAYAAGILNVKWGTDYLLKTIIGNISTPTNIDLVWQVRCALTVACAYAPVGSRLCSMLEAGNAVLRKCC